MSGHLELKCPWKGLGCTATRYVYSTELDAFFEAWRGGKDLSPWVFTCPFCKGRYRFSVSWSAGKETLCLDRIWEKTQLDVSEASWLL